MVAIERVLCRLNFKRFIWCSLLCFAAFIAVEVPAVAQEQAPRFEDYRVSTWRGKMAPLKLQSHPLARKYRTLIRQQMRDEGVNFAGRYTVASMGCGTGCSITSIVDARTGDAYFPKQLSGWTGIVGDYDPPENEDPWTFHSTSRSLRAIGRENIGGISEERYGPSGIYYYEWKNNRVLLVKFTHVGSYPDPDPPARQPHSRRQTIPTDQDKAR
jgi:hypothetical protein